MKIGFYGGVESVTGANFLLEGPGNYRVLIDCGMFQGGKLYEERNNAPFAYQPAEVQALLVTHAHLDHVGRIPQLVRAGFRGVIYSTPATRELAAVMLEDSLGVIEKDLRGTGRPLPYDVHDIERMVALWQVAEYHAPFPLGPFTVTAKNAGHILGSAVYELVADGTKVAFTGDMGGPTGTLLAPTEPLDRPDFLVMESVYGDRVHESRQSARERLEDVIENTMRAGGTLMIPAFSIERTQEILYAIEQMMEESRIPLVPVFLDSPLAIKVTGIYGKYRSQLKPGLEEALVRRDGMFAFPQLIKTPTTEESKAIAARLGRKIIIAGSGMSNGGRILHHEKRHLPDPNSTLLLVGYQAAGSLGRLLQEGVKNITILGTRLHVRASVITLSGYSGHRDAEELLELVAPAAANLKKVFVTMGELHASLSLAQRLRDYVGVQAVVPRPGQVVEL